MQHHIHSFTRTLTLGGILNATFDESESRPLVCADKCLNLFEVITVTRSEVIQSYDLLIELEQFFQQVRSDESRHAGDEPGARICLKSALQ